MGPQIFELFNPNLDPNLRSVVNDLAAKMLEKAADGHYGKDVK
jgi:hypothetical protein